MRFDCACADDGRQRCGEHAFMECHYKGVAEKAGECPVCWLARLRSVSLSSDATPTRGRK